MMDETKGRPPGKPVSAAPGVVSSSLHVAVMASLAVAQPIYDLLSRNAEFFVAHRAEPLDLVLLVGLLSLGSGLIFLLPLALARAFSRRLGRRPAAWLLWLTLGFLGFLTAMPPLRNLATMPGQVVLGLGLTAGVAFALAYRKWSALRSFLTLLSPAALIFPVLFLFFSPVRSLLLPQSQTVQQDGDGYLPIESSTPVVLVIFDELPLLSLLDADGNLDAGRYPNLHALSAESHWFGNAVTAAQDTTYAIPSIVTGRLPDRKRLATADDYPHNLFALLGRGGYSLRVMEAATHLCPRELCGADPTRRSRMDRLVEMTSDLRWVYLHLLLPEDLAAGFPAVSGGWKDFEGSSAGNLESDAPVQRSDVKWLSSRFLDWLREGEDSTLYYAHLNLPHLPWKYLPSGRTYGPMGAPLFPHGVEQNRWAGTPWEATQGLQRHLLQVGFVDRVVGQLGAALKAVGLYERALIILVSDHGASFRVGQVRRGLSAENLAEIVNVPLLVKLPGQKQGVVDDRLVQTTDILPSIAEVLGIEVPWQIDGRSLFDAATPARTTAQTFQTNKSRFGKPVTTTLERLVGERRQALEARTAVFMEGDPLRIARHAALVGRPVAELAAGPQFTGELALDQAWQFDDVLPEGEFIPAQITGRLSPEEPARELAVAVNGVLRAVTETYADSSGAGRFSAMVPEDSFVAGRNEIDVLVVDRDGDGVRLRRILRTESREFVLEQDRSGATLAIGSGASAARYPIPGERARGRARIGSNALQSFVRVVTFDKLRGQTLDRVLLFVDGRFVSSKTRDEALPKTEGEPRNRVKFQLALPDRAVSDDVSVRVIGLTAGQALEFEVER